MKKIDSIYLEKLEYDKNLEKGFFAFFLARFRFLFLVIIVIIVAGILSLRQLPLESSPEVDIGIGVVNVVLPGASPETIEDLITKKLENEISKIKEVDTITSTSRKSLSSVVVQFKSNANSSDAIRELKDKVDLAKINFPEDANEPSVNEVSFSDSPIWTFAISGDYSSQDLYNYGKLIKDELEKNFLVSEVTISGGEDSEIQVTIDPKKIESFGLSLSQINNAIKSSNFTLPIGEFDVGNFTHSMTIDERFYDISAIRNIPIINLGDTGIIYLKDLGKVEKTSKKKTTISRISSSDGETKNAVTLGVIKKSGGSIVDLVDDGNIQLEELQSKGIIPENLEITTIIDLSERIKLDLVSLIRDGLMTVFLVFITLFLIIGIKEALVAGVSAPLAFLMTFIIMFVYGQTLNFLSMFALILSLGLLVDDAIVVVSAINQYKRTGKFTTYQSALLVLRDYKKVLISTTLTVVWIFSAMLFMTGIIGKFIFSIPFIITVTLISSLLVALTINPALAVFLDRKNVIGKEKKAGFLDKGFISLEPLANIYEKIIRSFIGNKKYSKRFLFFTLFLFIISLYLPISGILKSDFFPKTDSDTIFVNIEAEPGTRLGVTDEITKKVEKIINKEEEIANFTVVVGSLSDAGGGGGGAPNYANITVNLIKEEYGRLESSMDIAERLRNEVESIEDAEVTVIEQSGGPPTGADFNLQVAGDDFDKLDKISNDVKNTLSNIPGVINIQTSRKPLPLEFKLNFDESKLYVNSLSLAQVSLFIKNAIDGTEATKIFLGNNEISVNTIYDEDYTDTLDKLKDLKLLNNKGNYVYLRDLLSIDLQKSVFSIQRIDQKRVIEISASANKNTTGTEIKRLFDEKMKNYKLPSGYEFITGGANEENAKSVMSLLVALIFGLIFIVATLVILFDSYKQSVIVLVTIPLSLIGVFFGLTLFGQPLSFPGLIGLVALFGIVIRNGIILFDKINQNINEGIEFKESIIDAGKTRLEPVFLTSICTVLGMIPLTLSNPTWTSLGLSIIFGMSVSTVFTLLVLPILYYIFIKNKKNTDIINQNSEIINKQNIRI